MRIEDEENIGQRGNFRACAGNKKPLRAVAPPRAWIKATAHIWVGVGPPTSKMAKTEFGQSYYNATL